MAKPVVIVVGADKGGVGKTTVSRTLLDYFSANNVPTRAFDTESPRGTLKRFHPEFTEIVDMTTTSDQMKIFDTLNSSGPSVTVIDVRAGLLSPSLAALRDIGFLDAAKSGQITFAVFHILGSSIASLVEVASVPFLKFVANKGLNDEAANYSFVLRGYVRHWLANVWSEFDRIKLTDLVSSGKAAPRISGEK